MSKRPVVYLIDNDDQTSAANQLINLGIEAAYLYPTEVEEHHLRRATLLAVDEYFDLRQRAPDEDLEVPEGAQLALVPADGLALAAVLRSAAASDRVGRRVPLGITLRTGELDALAGDHPKAVRQPFLAAQHDLEWVAPKEGGSGDAVLPLVALAQALANYPTQWHDPNPREVGLLWLNIPGTSWASLARDQVLQCRPPAQVHKQAAGGLGWLRWLAHRVLPFPTFLISDVYAAARLGVTLGSLRATMTDDEGLRDAMGATRYEGPLAGLVDARYWRAGIDALATGFTGSDDGEDPFLVAQAAAARHSGLEPLNIDDPVVTIDLDYVAHERPIAREGARRLAPDGWPAYADPPWASATEAANPDMVDMLAPRIS